MPLSISISQRLGNAEVAAIAEGGGGGGGSGPVAYYLFEDFNTDTAAPIPVGHPASPGPGAVTARNDPSNLISIAGGQLIINGNSLGLWYQAITRAAGQLLIFDADNFKHSSNGFDNDTTGGAGAGVSMVVQSDDTMRVAAPGGTATIGTYAGELRIAIALRDLGAYFFVETTGGEWELRFISFYNSSASLYVAITSQSTLTGGGQPLRFNAIYAPIAAFSPVPALSDGFSGAATVTDGLGHPEGVAGGVGAGGGGEAWAGNAWANASGVTRNNPSLTNKVTNGGFETWTVITMPDNWTPSVGGLTTVSRETVEVHGGIYAVKFAVDASNSVAKIQQTIANTSGDLLLVTFWAKGTVDGRTLAVDENFGSNVGPNLRITTAYRRFCTLIRTTASNTNVGIKRSSATNTTIYIDDATIDVVSLFDLVRTANIGAASYVMAAEIVPGGGEFTGFIIGANAQVGASAPDTFVAVVMAGDARFRIFEVNSGVFTYVADLDVVAAASYRVEVIKRAGKYRVYCNGLSVSGEFTATNAAVFTTSTIAGLFATGPLGSIDNLEVYEVGSGGLYDAIDAHFVAGNPSFSTWAVDGSGNAYNTPALGPQLFANPNFDDATAWAKGSNWTISGGVATAVNAGNNVTQSVSAPDRYTLIIGDIVTITAGTPRFVTGSQFSDVFTTTGTKRTAYYQRFGNSIGMSGVGYSGSIDNMYGYDIDDATVFALWRRTDDPAKVAAKFPVATDNIQSAVIGWANDPTNPTSYIGAVRVHRFEHTIGVMKMVNGVLSITNQIAVTFVANAEVELRRSGDIVQIWYDGVQLGVDVAVTDAEVSLDNEYFGLQSLDPSTKISQLLIDDVVVPFNF